MSDTLVVAEHRRGELEDISYELITAGRELADAMDGDLHVAVINGDVDSHAEQLDRDGVDTIHTVDYGKGFNHDVYTQAVTELADSLSPRTVLIPHTATGMDYAPAVANALDNPLVTDAIDLQYDEELTVAREMYSSKLESVIATDSTQAVVTVRPAEWPPTESDGSAAIDAFEAEIDEAAITSTVMGFEETVGGDIDISEADFIVSVGRGIEDEENLELIERLCDVTGATLAASRPICDNEWLSKGRQVGQSGKDVTPDVYVAIGISGAVQHVSGMKNSERIVAINNDSTAPIFDIADYGIVGDLFEVVPALIEEVE